MHPVPHVAIVAFYVGLNAVLLLGLAYNVGARRRAQNAMEPGATGDARLTRAIRAHGNFTEYAPMVLLVFLLLAALGEETLRLHCFGVLFTGGRISHALGMMQARHPNPARFIGNLSTGIALLYGGIACIGFALRGLQPT